MKFILLEIVGNNTQTMEELCKLVKSPWSAAHGGASEWCSSNGEGKERERELCAGGICRQLRVRKMRSHSW